MKFFWALSILLILVNCSNPGYSIRINIDKAAKASDEDMEFIKHCLKKISHETLLIKEGNLWKVESYKINLNEKKFFHFKHRYINFAVEYYYDQEDAEKKKLEKIEVRIGNSWEGRDPILKNEIDKVADYTINQLRERFDISNISIERRYTGPI